MKRTLHLVNCYSIVLAESAKMAIDTVKEYTKLLCIRVRDKEEDCFADIQKNLPRESNLNDRYLVSGDDWESLESKESIGAYCERYHTEKPKALLEAEELLCNHGYFIIAPQKNYINVIND